MHNLYDDKFFRLQQSRSYQSAQKVVPIILELFPARSVVDVGCGVGAWLRAFSECGVAEIVGYDGDYLDPDLLIIPRDTFHAADLRREFAFQRRFDLAVSLEVAEHLSAACAADFIRLLTSAAPVVLFSAAIPHQGGVDHVNEQWQDYWRALFSIHNYQPVDCLRPLIMGYQDVDYWYQQNIIAYCSPETMQSRPDLVQVPAHLSLNLVHQQLYEANLGLRRVLHSFPSVLGKTIVKRLRQMPQPKA